MSWTVKYCKIAYSWTSRWKETFQLSREFNSISIHVINLTIVSYFWMVFLDRFNIQFFRALSSIKIREREFALPQICISESICVSTKLRCNEKCKKRKSFQLDGNQKFSLFFSDNFNIFTYYFDILIRCSGYSGEQKFCISIIILLRKGSKIKFLHGHYENS